MPPPPPNSVASRLFLGPALRTQPDRRLVSLVRSGYETAFEEIVRRYGKPLGRYAAAIVPSHRAEDVTQDAFSKALLALRDTDKEIELRPWLYRIVRNTALNDLRDQPAPTAPLHENIDGVETPPEAAERREEIAELLGRLRALPDSQRAAIVMRELEGLSHEEIAAALGITGSAARQAIYRARTALRDGVGLLLPLPVLKLLLSGSAGAQAGAGLGGAAAASAGGAGGGMALKTAAATLLVAGTVGTGVALDDNGAQSGARPSSDPQRAAEARSGGTADGLGGRALLADESATEDRDRGPGGGAGGPGPGEDRHTGSGSGDSRSGEDRSGDRSGDGGGSSSSGPGPGTGSDDGLDGSGSGSSGSGSSGDGGSISGSSGPGPSGSEDPLFELSGTDRSGSDSGSGSSGSGEGSSGSGTSGSGDLSGGFGSD